MPETWYRASRCCRVLGNPTAYLILKCLAEKRRTPTELAEELGVGLTTVSATLRHLRESDLVRYLTRGKEKAYWVKDERLLESMALVERFVETMRTKER